MRSSIENPTVPVSQTTEFLSFFGMDSVNLPRVTVDRALTVPAVAAAVLFLSRTMASLPIHAYQKKNGTKEKLRGETADVIHDAWNDEASSVDGRRYFWQQVFTHGRGLAIIERRGEEIINLFPMASAKVTIKRVNNRKTYTYLGRVYSSSDVVDVPFMLKDDQLSHSGPIAMASKAIQLALAMNDYAATFFAGGGVPPLALKGPLPAGKDAVQRAVTDVTRAIDDAKRTGRPITPIPGGYELVPVGVDPAKGQMTDARLFQVQEIARVWQIPPVFLQDLSKGTFSNVEQQDLHLIKHLVGQWTKIFEGELTLKCFGRGKNRADRSVEHNLDGLMRGDFKSRIEGIARAIQTAQLTPNEARALENRPQHENAAANDLLVQGATVPLGTQPTLTAPKDGDSNAEQGA